MTLADFFLAVNTAGVRLANVGGRLQLRGRPEAITSEIRAGAAEHKAAVLSLLPPTPAPEAAEAQPPEPPVGTPATTGNGTDGPTRRAGDAAALAEDLPLRDSWLDWRSEWLLELAVLSLRMRGCTDPDILARLRPLADATPTSLAEWLALGQQIVNTEHELSRVGKLPAYPWPGRGNT
jgi:hypothetical protein